MQQWLVADAVGGTQSLGVGVDGTTERGPWLSISTAEEQLHALLTTPASGDVGGMLMAAVVLLVLGLGGVAVWHSNIPALLSGTRTSESESRDTATDSPQTTESPPEPGTAESPAADAGGKSAEPAQRTDQELIVDILESNEGRMKQAMIVDETGWSKSKVSMLLSEMEDDGDISKLRVGRENIISLSGNEPEAAGSPFDDE
ncbi:helix-turn-helix transcriptional regulator [Halosimplex amylolyticum]|uniref:helix-turn-helix transcriptional regulator n=1 Tax=Halosimplex amylolyticum TaxID=3396616 RepID=UPI003F547B05